MNFSLSFPTQRYFRFGVSIFYFIQGITFATWASRIPDIKNALQLSDAQLGGVLFALPVGQLAAMALSGYLVNKFDSRRVLLIAAVFYPATLFLLGSVQSIGQLFAALSLFGVFGNLSNISVNTQGVGVERIYRRSIMASFHGLWSLAGFTGGLISSFMVAEHISPFDHFTIIFLLTIALLAIAYRYMLPRDAKQRQNSEKKRFSFKLEKSILTLGLIAFACMICEGTMFDWSAIYFEKVVEAPLELTRLGYIAFMCTMAGGRFAADALTTRFGNKTILQSSGILIFSGMAIAVIHPNIVTATIGFLLVGLGTSSVVPLVYSQAGKTSSLSPGVAIAAVSSIGFLGFLIGPPIIGFIAEWLNLRWAFLIMAILGLGTTFMAGKTNNI